MTRNKKQLPTGVEDFLPQECYLRRTIETNLRDVFTLSGYEEVSTPAYEYYDVFASGAGSYLQEKMIKFIDSKGAILALRPDVTIPIARMAASKLLGEKKTLRLFYFENAYRNEAPAVGRSSEFYQAGIELLGESGTGADAEVIALAVESLLSSGLSNFKIDIGQVSYFKAMIDAYDFDDEAVDQIRHQIDSKNEYELMTLLDSLNADNALKSRLKAVMGLFGGAEVFDKARALSDNSACLEAVDNLAEVYGLLSDFGLSQYISIDFGMLHDISYYTGIIFRGITDKMGFALITGGRYDNLLSDFGNDTPATGFALEIKRLMIALERQNRLDGFYQTDMVVSCAAGYADKAFKYVQGERQLGKRVLFCANLTKEDLNRLKNETEASQAVFID